MDESLEREQRAVAEHEAAAHLALGEVDSAHWSRYERLAELLSRTVVVNQGPWSCWQLKNEALQETVVNAFLLIAWALGSVESMGPFSVERECGNQRCFNPGHVRRVDPKKIVMRPLSGVPMLGVPAITPYFIELCSDCTKLHAEFFFPTFGVGERLDDIERKAGSHAAAAWLLAAFRSWLLDRDGQISKVNPRYQGNQ